MTNRIDFSILTEAKYTEAERVDLLDAFLAFMNDVDGDVVEDSETVSIVDADEPSSGVTEQQKQEVIEEFLGKITLSASIMLDGEELAVNSDV